MKILLTAVGGPSGICFAKSLSEIADVELVGVSAEEDSIGKSLVDVFHIVPFASDPAYLEIVQNIIKNEKVDYVIPTVDEEMCLLSKHSEDVGCRVFVSPFETIAYTSNKGKMYTVASDYLPRRFTKELIPAFPAFAKPEVGRGGKGAFVVRDIGALDTIPDAGYVVQELLHEPEVSVDALFDFDGNLVVAVARVRSRIDQGVSVSGEVFRDDALQGIVSELARRMRFVGPVNFQFMRAADGYKLIEINARASGGMGITIGSGVDIPKLSYELMNTGAIESVPQVCEGLYNNFEEVIERQRQKKTMP